MKQLAAVLVAVLSATVKGGLRTRHVGAPDRQRGQPKTASIGVPHQSRGLVGGDYCVWSPNYACWPSSRGFPPCCIDANVTCPDEVPACENSDVESYCVADPDTTCYLEGWPGCCSAGRCPLQQPPCDVETGTVSTESSSSPKGTYCSMSPEYDCFSDGLPACCRLGENRCPIERPPCDVAATTSTTSTEAATSQQTTTVPIIPEMTFPPKEEVEETDPSTAFPPRPELGTKPPDEGLATAGIPAAYCSFEANYTCYAAGVPSCCIFDSCSTQTQPPCEVIETYVVSTPAPADEVPSPESFGELSPPEEGLRACNEVIPSAYPDNIIPREVVLATLEGMIDFYGEVFAPFKYVLSLMSEYDVRAHKVCTSCEEVYTLWGGSEDASDAMPYCKPGSFASGRTFSALVLEPIDPATKAPITGKVAATVWNWATQPEPFSAPSVVWPNDITTSPVEYIAALSAATAGTYTIIPDVLGNGEDWSGTRSYIVKDVYSASAVPILLKLKSAIDGGGCTELDKRVSIVGYSEGGYAAVAVANAVDILNDGWVHTHTAVAGAPIKLATAQLEAIVDMSLNSYPFPAFSARMGNAYSSTNQDIANTGAQQPAASPEYLDETDPTKNLVEWARKGLSYQEMSPLLPGPLTFGTQSDIVNPDFVNMVVSAFDDGVTDPCNSKYASDSVESLCQAILDNDLESVLKGFDYPVVLCHSNTDELVPYSNVVESSELLVLQQNVPEMSLLNPDGLTHLQASVVCSLGFMVPYASPPEAGEIRAIFPLEDADKSCTESTETAQEVQGEDEVSSSQTDPTTPMPNSENAPELGAEKDSPEDGEDGEPPAASSSSLNCCAYFSVVSMFVLVILS